MSELSLERISASTPLLAAEDAEQSTGASTSSLSNRVEAERPGNPRAGLLGKLGALFNRFASRLSVTEPSTGRLLNAQRAERQLAEGIVRTVDTLASRGASEIEEALVRTGTTSRSVGLAGGNRHAALEKLTEHLSNLDSTQLQQLAIRLRDDAVGKAQSSLADRPEAAQLLMEIELAVNSELTRRIDSTVDRALQSASTGLWSGDAPARIEDNLHFAFDSAVPLVKLGVLRAGEETDAAVDRIVLERLGHLPEADQKSLLAQMNTKDLARLRRAGVAPSSAPAVSARVEAEISARPERLSAAFERQALDFSNRYNAGRPLDHDAFVRDLAQLGASSAALSEHCACHHLPAPDAAWPTLTRTEMLVKAGVCAEAVIRSGRFDLQQARPGQLSTLSAAFNELGLTDVTRSVLGKAQQAHLDSQRKNFQQQLGSVLDGIAQGQEPRGLLSSLVTLEQASSTLREAATTFAQSAGPASSPVSPAATEADRVESAAIAECLHQLPAQKRAALTRALSQPHNQALVSALHVGAGLAFDTHETRVGNRLSTLARVLDEVARQSDATTSPPGQGESASLRAHQFFAAQNLTPQAQEAFRDLYGLELPREGQPGLYAGRLPPERVSAMAQLLERPASAGESRLVDVGPYKVGEGFHKDAGRRFAYFLPAPRTIGEGTQDRSSPRPLSRGSTFETARGGEPMIDTSNWPGGDLTEEDLRQGSESDYLGTLAARDERIAEGYARLVDLCGGNEAQARTLTLYAYQSVMASFFLGLGSDGLTLQDGRSGFIMTGSKGGHASENTEISFSIGPNGRPQMDVDYQLAGRHTFHMGDGTRLVLSPDSSLQAHFRVELQENNTLKLLEAPSYRVDLRPAEFQESYPEPTLSHVRSAAHDDAALQDLIAYANSVGREHEILAYRALRDVGKQPTLLDAAALLSGARGIPADTVQQFVPAEDRAKIVNALEPLRPGVRATFDAAAAGALALRLNDNTTPQESARARQFLDELDDLGTKNDPRLFEKAEQLYKEFIAGTGSGAPLPLTSKARAEIRSKLDLQLYAARAPVAANLFSDLEQTLGSRIEKELLPGMIAQVKAQQS